MKKIIFVLVMSSSLSAFAGQCFIVTYENGSSMNNITKNNTSLKTCMGKAARVLQSVLDRDNPTVKVYHPQIPAGILLRKEDGLMFNPNL